MGVVDDWTTLADNSVLVEDDDTARIEETTTPKAAPLLIATTPKGSPSSPPVKSSSLEVHLALTAKSPGQPNLMKRQMAPKKSLPQPKKAPSSAPLTWIPKAKAALLEAPDWVQAVR